MLSEFEFQIALPQRRRFDEALNVALSKLNTGEGSAGRLLTDTSLYRDVRNLVGSVDSLMNDFKKNPRKYINLRIF